MSMNYYNIKENDIANGPGCRVSIWFSGCTRKCKGCFNKEAWDFESGQVFDVQKRYELYAMLRKDSCAGLSILGGEPLQQNPEELWQFIEQARTFMRPNQTIWLWTGYRLNPNRFDFKDKTMGLTPEQFEVVKRCDFVVDGAFDEVLFDPNLRFRGSSNQKIYYIKKINGLCGIKHEDVTDKIQNCQTIK